MRMALTTSARTVAGTWVPKSSGRVDAAAALATLPAVDDHVPPATSFDITEETGAVFGENVNVGAGTITCNYDGTAKHRTTIEDGAFIGSDSQLIAPVTVRRGATLAAGTTLTREAPADQLTLSRARQVTLGTLGLMVGIW